jgi:hypothetical protein
MKHLKLVLSMMLVASMSLFIFSCGEDEEPETLPPTLVFTDGDGTINSERGESVDIEVSLIAQGGIQSLTANGSNVPVTAGGLQQIVTYTYAVAANAALGNQAVEFILTDNKNRTVAATYTITVIGSTIQVTNDIVSNTTWAEGNIYVLNNTIKVENATLTIEKGVTVQAVDDGVAIQDASKVLVALRVEPTGRITAIGEAAKPIVFTVKPQGTSAAAPGMWRGLIIKGDPLSANHNAGTLRYVRIEFGGGDEDSPTSNKGSLTFVDVGIATTVEFVQTFRGLGEGFRIEGSTLALKNCIATECLGAHLNTRHTGTTAAANIRYTNVYVQNFISNNATIGKDSRDLLMSNPPSGTLGNTLTMSNSTFIGPGSAHTVGGAPSSADGMRAESRNGKVLIYNSIWAEFPEDGIRLSSNAASTNSIIDFNYIFKIGGVDASGIPTLGNSTALRENAVVFASTPYVNNINPTTTTIAGIGVADYTPNASQASTYNPTSLNDSNFSFQSQLYVGAIGATDWTIGGWVRNADGAIRQ